jgi:membrane-associated phospholipid phosphatase
VSGQAATDRPVAGIQRPKLATSIVVAGFVSLLIGLLVFGSLAVEIRDQELSALDSVANLFLHDRASPLRDLIMYAASFVGSDFGILPLLALSLAILLRGGHVRESVFLGVAVAGSAMLNWAMKLTFQRPRPKLPWANVMPDYSFPSGHTMNSFVLFVSLALLAWAFFGRRIGVLALAVALGIVFLVGTSRIYLGYHYFTDVIGGAAAGLVWILIVGGALQFGPTVAGWRLRPAKPVPVGRRGRGHARG